MGAKQWRHVYKRGKGALGCPSLYDMLPPEATQQVLQRSRRIPAVQRNRLLGGGAVEARTVQRRDGCN